MEENYSKAMQLDAFQKARGIWKDIPEIDSVFCELREKWQQWRKDLEGSVRHKCCH